METRKEKTLYFSILIALFPQFLNKGPHNYFAVGPQIIQLALFPEWIFKILNNDYSMDPT